jgi:hypothetical protein
MVVCWESSRSLPTSQGSKLSSADSDLTVRSTGLVLRAPGFVSELRALRVDRFDTLRRTVPVSSSLVESGGEFYFGEPKSEASGGTVRVPTFLVNALVAHLAKHADDSVSYSRRQPAGRSGGVTSGAASGCRR